MTFSKKTLDITAKKMSNITIEDIVNEVKVRHPKLYKQIDFVSYDTLTEGWKIENGNEIELPPCLNIRLLTAERAEEENQRRLDFDLSEGTIICPIHDFTEIAKDQVYNFEHCAIYFDHELIFDNRDLPEKILGIKVMNVWNYYAEEFVSNMYKMGIEQGESPFLYRRFVNRHLPEIKEKLKAPNMSKQEALDALTGGFKKYVEESDRMRSNTINKELKEIQMSLENKLAKDIKSLRIKNEDLSDALKNAGYSVFYTSPYSSLKQGEFYFIGLNPRSEMTNINQDLGSLSDAFCEYDPIQSDWGNSNLQKRAHEILQFLCTLSEDEDLKPENIFSTNWSFYKSKDASELLSYGNDVIDFWKYHKKFLSQIRPKVIVCNGNSEGYSPYKMMMSKLNGSNTVKHVLYNSFSIKIGEGKLDAEPVTIIGLPHLSRVDPHYQNGKMFEIMKEVISLDR